MKGTWSANRHTSLGLYWDWLTWYSSKNSKKGYCGVSLSVSHILRFFHSLFSSLVTLSQSQHDEWLRFIALSHRDNSDTAIQPWATLTVSHVFPRHSDRIQNRDKKIAAVLLDQKHSFYKAHVVSSEHHFNMRNGLLNPTVHPSKVSTL